MSERPREAAPFVLPEPISHAEFERQVDTLISESPGMLRREAVAWVRWAQPWGPAPAPDRVQEFPAVHA